jgi:hypothetical protein
MKYRRVSISIWRYSILMHTVVDLPGLGVLNTPTLIDTSEDSSKAADGDDDAI